MSDENMVTRAEMEAAVASARAEGVTEGRKEGATAERGRISAILGLDEAKGREASAQHLALNTELTADDAKGVLSGLPEASAPETPLRTADAPGGLITVEPSKPAPSGSTAKALWSSAVSSLNGGNRAGR